MGKRLLTPKSGVTELLRQPPALSFRGKTRADWQAWRRKFHAALLRVMGPVPKPAPLRIKVVQREQLAGYTLEKIEFNTDAFSTVPAYLLIPDGPGRKAGVLCAHGHGSGKAGVFTEGPP